MTTQISPTVEGDLSPEEVWRRAASRAAHPSSVGLDTDVLSAIAEGLAAVTVPWEIRTGEVPAERQYERILVTAAYDVWVICWPTGTGLELHDHGGSAGAFSVVTGQLDEVRLVDGIERQRSFGRGDTVSFGTDYVHAVSNNHTELATSVHVYSPPLEWDVPE